MEKNLTIEEISEQMEKIGNNVRFVSLVYTSKPKKVGEVGETSRYTILVGSDYCNLLRRSIEMLRDTLPTLSGLEKTAGEEVLASLEKSLLYQSMKMQNPDYTKKGLYKHIGVGLKININDKTLELDGLAHTKTVLVEGIRKPVKSSDLTIAKKKITDGLPSGKYRSFSLDEGNIHSVRINGDVLVLE